MESCGVKSVAVLDRAGMSVSLACAVHCAVFPLVLAALPALGLAWLDAEWVDWTMVLLAAGITLRAHRVGFLTIVATICLLRSNASQHYMQASGAVVVAGSHFLNRHLCRTCTVCKEKRELCPTSTICPTKSSGPRRPGGGLETYEKTCPDDLWQVLQRHPSRRWDLSQHSMG
jgi:MerC mercury resistance protein